MNMSPTTHALIALAYIVTLVTFVFGSERLADVVGAPSSSIFYPMAMISLLVFSVALMAYLFFYRPLTLILEHKTTEALAFFARQLIVFGVGIACILLAALVFNIEWD
jgi:hypothetical protein